MTLLLEPPAALLSAGGLGCRDAGELLLLSISLLELLAHARACGVCVVALPASDLGVCAGGEGLSLLALRHAAPLGAPSAGCPRPALGAQALARALRGARGGGPPARQLAPETLAAAAGGGGGRPEAPPPEGERQSAYAAGALIGELLAALPRAAAAAAAAAAASRRRRRRGCSRRFPGG